MKRALLLVWVFMSSTGLLSAIDPQNLVGRQQECQRMSKEFTQHAKELETRAKQLEGDAAKAVTELSALKKEEAENFAELAEAIEKKQWSSIKRYEKKGEKLCHEWTEKMEKFEKKFGDKSEQHAKQEWKKEGDSSSEKPEASVAKSEGKEHPKPEGKEPPKSPWKPEPKPEPPVEAKSEPTPENPNAGLDKINAQAQGLGNP